MIGGIGPESTAIYYRKIVASYRERKGDGSNPSLIINSINMAAVLGLIEAGETRELVDYLAGEVERLAAAGAVFGFLSANAPHIVFGQLERRARIPLLSIVESACSAASKAGYKHLGLLGARFTMQGVFYPEVFSRQGISLLLPSPAEQAYIHEKYLGELVNGVIDAATREKFVEIMHRLRKQEGVEGIILGGTELSLMFQDEEVEGIPLLDTTTIHVQEIVARLVE